MENPVYDGLAAFYDEFQQDLDNEARAAFIHSLVEDRGCGSPQGAGGRPLLLDLGCGTGAIFPYLTKLGYDLIGIDRSPLMLMAAREQGYAGGEGEQIQEIEPPLLLMQDITRFELFGPVNVITCLLDTVNHLVEVEQVLSMFKLCRHYLEPGGLFIFDALTEQHLARTLGQQQFFSVADAACLFWQNAYDAATGLSRAEITTFAAVEGAQRKQQSTDLYRRSDFVIEERFYAEQDLLAWLHQAGFAEAVCLPDGLRAASGPAAGGTSGGAKEPARGPAAAEAIAPGDRTVDSRAYFVAR